MNITFVSSFVIFISYISPRLTTSIPMSGSYTFVRASSICSSVTIFNLE